MTHGSRALIFLACIACLCSACTDEVNKAFSTKYPVRFFFETAQSPDLYNTMNGMGIFLSIRQSNGKIRIITPEGRYTDFNPSAIGATDYRYGLGGLIVGVTYTGDPVAYDLSCPTCDRQSHRLTVSGDGYATCEKCGTRYDLNNYGTIFSTLEPKPDNLRPLYRYRIIYNGVSINVFN